MSKARGAWITELKLGATFFTDNDRFYGGVTRSQVDGRYNRDLQQNWRVGASLSLPVDRANSVKFALSSGVYARTGNEFDAVAVSWQHRWGGGL